MIQDAIATHKKIALAKERHIELKQPFPAHARVLGHSSSLQVVFANLIAHSLYYTKEQGTAEIAYTDRGTFHEFSTFSPGDTLKENEVTSLFSAYYKGEKLSSHTQSTGLGLYLIHKIVRLHGGTVSAIPGEEGVFLTVTLPKQQ